MNSTPKIPLEITTENHTATCEFSAGTWACRIRENRLPYRVLRDSHWGELRDAVNWALNVLYPDCGPLSTAILEAVRLYPKEGVDVDTLALSVSYSTGYPVAEVHTTIATLTAPQGPLVVIHRLGQCDIVRKL